MKKKTRCWIVLCAVCVMLWAAYVPAGAVNAPAATDTGQVQENSETVSGIEPVKPSTTVPQKQGKADIEKVFPATKGSSERSANAPLAGKQSVDNKELPITYDQQQNESVSESSTLQEAKDTDFQLNKSVLIAVILILFLTMVFIVLKNKRRKEKQK